MLFSVYVLWKQYLCVFASVYLRVYPFAYTFVSYVCMHVRGWVCAVLVWVWCGYDVGMMRDVIGEYEEQQMHCRGDPTAAGKSRQHCSWWSAAWQQSPQELFGNKSPRFDLWQDVQSTVNVDAVETVCTVIIWPETLRHSRCVICRQTHQTMESRGDGQRQSHQDTSGSSLSLSSFSQGSETNAPIVRNFQIVQITHAHYSWYRGQLANCSTKGWKMTRKWWQETICVSEPEQFTRSLIREWNRWRARRRLDHASPFCLIELPTCLAWSTYDMQAYT